MTPRLNREDAVFFISTLRLYRAFAASMSPSSSFWVPRSRHWFACTSAGSEAVECGVVDVAKPAMNGEQAARKLRARQNTYVVLGNRSGAIGECCGGRGRREARPRTERVA